VSLVLGLDPGSLRLGYGLIETNGSQLLHREHGVFVASPKGELATRLLHLHGRLSELLERVRPDAVGIERVFAAQNARSALVLGQARGIVLLAVAQHGLSLAEYAPAEVKLAVTGHGRASKLQLAAMVERLLGGRPDSQSLDASDALAIAICHVQSQARARLVARARGETS
jgi:crossover junction endodeoxyribonuclease RuvC